MTSGTGLEGISSVAAILWAAVACVSLYVMVPTRPARTVLGCVSAFLIGVALILQLGMFGEPAIIGTGTFNSHTFVLLGALPLLLAVLLGARYRQDRAIQDQALARTDGAVAVFDVKGKLQYVNAAFLRLVGLSDAREALGRQAQDFFSNREDADLALDAVLTAGNWHGEVATVTPDGTQKEAEIGMSLARDSEGTPTAIIGSFADVGERKLAVQELKLNQTLLTAVGEVAPVVLWSADDQDRIQFSTGIGLDAWQTDGPGDESNGPFAIGTTLADLFADNQDATISLERAKGGHSSRFAHTLFQVPVQTNIGPQVNSSGRVIGVVGVSLVEAPASPAIEQDESVDTTDLRDQQLQIVGRLTDGIAHDFNNLLTTMLGNLDMVVEQTSKESDLHQFASAAARAAERGAELTQRLIDFAKRLPPEPSDTDINDLLIGMQALLKPALPPFVSLNIRPAVDPISANVDAMQLEAAIISIALDAGDVVPRGGKIEISVSENGPDQRGSADRHENGASNAVIAITISNTVGEQTAVADHSPHSYPRDNFALVRRFVEESNGSIHVTCEPGQNASVTLVLPRAASHQEPAQNCDPAKRRIMVVEDDPDVRDFVVNALTRMGYSVIWAADGHEALNVAEDNETIDMLISDVVLPGEMTGPDVVDRLLHRFPDTKVLFTSGYLGDDLKIHGRFEEDAELLSKPYTIQALSDKVKQALEPTIH